MELYLVQHGKAEPKEVNPDRPLSESGREETQRMAELAAKLGLEVAEIQHSGKKRAEQTAVMFARALNCMGRVSTTTGTGPTDDVRPYVERLAHANRPLMLVGHLPFLSRLAGLLVHGDAEKSPVEFRNSGIICLSKERQGWRVLWSLNPGENGGGGV